MSASITGLIGQQFGPYRIVSLLGAGGMGEVYRAHDMTLARDVALKFLPREFVNDPERLARFEREARVLASLNHPNVAAIYGIADPPFEGEASGGDRDRMRALVLELVEGETLSDRLVRGPVEPLEAVMIARQIGEALDAAHSRGIIHRDLKPSNIKFTPAGTLKVLDFGLAKESGTVSSDFTHSPTMTRSGTRAGVLLGTAAYMSPEQARGYVVDKRADIWAFGCVMYEMLAGHAAFQGATVTDVLAAIVQNEPRWDDLPVSTPSWIRAVVKRCLEKDLRQRTRDIGDVLLDLETPAVSPSAPDRASRSTFNRWPVTAAALALAGALGFGVARQLAPAAEPAEGTALPVLSQLTFDDGFTADPDVSRDGALITYASDRGGQDHTDIWIQQVSGSPPIRVTRDPVDEREPVFSPDGTRIAFRSERDGGGIYIVPAFGTEAPRFVVAGGRRPRFSPDGQLVAYWTGGNIGFSRNPDSYRAFIVPASGGVPKEIAPQMTGVRFPVWSPDGRALLVHASAAATPVEESYDWWLVPVDGSTPTAVGTTDLFRASGLQTNTVTSGINSAAASIGPDVWSQSRVLFSDFRFLWSLPLDSRTNSVNGPIERLTLSTNHDAQPAVSASGAIVYSSAAFVNTIWGLPLEVNRGTVTGEPVRVTEGVSYDARATASSDGRLVTYRSTTAQTTVLVRDTTTRGVTDLGVRGSNFGAAISPDGLVVALEVESGVELAPAKGGERRQLCRGCQIGDWTEDSSAIAVVTRSGLALIDVRTASSRDLVQRERLNRPFVSPNKRLLAFRGADEKGDVLWVAPVSDEGPTPMTKWRALSSPEGDIRPAGWSPNGSLLYFVSSRDGTRCLYALRVERNTGASIGDAIPVRHFHGNRNGWAGTTGVLSTGPANAVRGGRFLYDIASFSSNIWMLSGR